MLNDNIKNNAKEIISEISNSLFQSTYISILLFTNEKLVVRESNNYNNWEIKYNNDDMLQDHVFQEMAKKKIEPCTKGVILWSTIPHTTPESYDVDKKREANNICNGISILERIDDENVIAINLASNKEVGEDEFFSEVIRKRGQFMERFKRKCSIT